VTYGKIEERKIHLKFKLGISKVAGYDFPHPRDGLWNSHLFFKQPLVDTEFNLPDAGYTLLTVYSSPFVRDITLLLHFVWGCLCLVH
jgi:hypothetical protein